MAYLGRQLIEGPAISIAPASAAEDADAFRLAMREFASGVAIVAAGRDTERNGCTATSLCSLSVEPPSLVVCLSRASATLTTVRCEGAFGVSVLASQHADLASRFAGRCGLRGADRFDGAAWTSLASGAPLLQGALAIIDCEVEDTIERHTHAIVIGRVLAAQVLGGRPLAHWRGRSSPLI